MAPQCDVTSAVKTLIINKMLWTTQRPTQNPTNQFLLWLKVERKRTDILRVPTYFSKNTCTIHSFCFQCTTDIWELTVIHFTVIHKNIWIENVLTH
jgi:hypothetical protein